MPVKTPPSPNYRAGFHAYNFKCSCRNFPCWCLPQAGLLSLKELSLQNQSSFLSKRVVEKKCISLLLERTSKRTPVTFCLRLQCPRAVLGLCGRSSSAAVEPGPPKLLHPPHACTLPLSSLLTLSHHPASQQRCLVWGSP